MALAYTTETEAATFLPRPPEEVARIVSAANQEKTRIPDAGSFNAMALAQLSAKQFPGADLATACDMGSLLRLAELYGGQTLRIPTLAEVWLAYLTVISAWLIKVKKWPPSRVYREIKKFARKASLELPPQRVWTRRINKTFEGVSISLSSSRSGVPYRTALEQRVFALCRHLGDLDEELLRRANTRAALTARREKIHEELQQTWEVLREILRSTRELAMALNKDRSPADR